MPYGIKQCYLLLGGGFKRGEAAPTPIDRMHLKTSKIFAQNALFLPKIFRNLGGRSMAPSLDPPLSFRSPYSKFLDPPLLLLYTDERAPP